MLDFRLTYHLRRLGSELLVWLLLFGPPLAVFWLMGCEPWRDADGSTPLPTYSELRQARPSPKGPDR